MKKPHTDQLHEDDNHICDTCMIVGVNDSHGYCAICGLDDWRPARKEEKFTATYTTRVVEAYLEILGPLAVLRPRLERLLRILGGGPSLKRLIEVYNKSK